MTDFLSAIYSSPHWVFIALGGLLLIAEVLGTAGYGLWSGIAAIIVGLIAWLLPLSWSSLWILFAIFTLISAYLWWLWQKRSDQRKSKKEAINQPQKDLIGVRTIVTEAITNGSGRVKIKDGSWFATCDVDLAKGTPVEVIAIDDLVLTVKALSN
ncbi:hypothetical protein A9G11_11015 [Gilliamella sp. wkB108]|uniref:NfeD family protein n=1 Tax=Gilliamella sp. wkB108 TaxID=3120256 RepID=UPI00080E3430|nr:NfeD family protein [Gilliamella apicola]OCG28340.1 hypothetical protein A9G11_11015 [Gilliamella apicola]